MNVYLASPCATCPEPETATSWEASRDELRARGHFVTPVNWIRGLLVHHARNTIVESFLKTPCDVLAMADTDHQWQAPDLVNALDFCAAGAGVVGFAHPYRWPDVVGALGPLTSPRLLPERPIERATHAGATYIACRAVGGGLLCMSRRAIEALSQRARDAGGIVFDLSDPTTSEDVRMCADWRSLGGKVWCSLNAVVGHIGKKIYTASLVDELARLEARERARERVTSERALTRLLPPKDGDNEEVTEA